MRTIVQALDDNVGTPSHTTVAVMHSNKTTSVARSVGRELDVVKRTLNSLSVWKEGVVQHMSENREDMAAVNKKLDLLLQAILPSTVKPAAEVESCEPQKEDFASAEHEHVGGDDDGERADVITITAAGQEKTCSTSLMSDELGGTFPGTAIPGRCS